VYVLKFNLRKVFSLVLSVLMVVSSVLPRQVRASQYDYPNYDSNLEIENNEENEFYESIDVDPSLVPINFEDINKRNEYEKYFRKIDGTYEVSIYDEAVHYKEDGKWKDINNKMSYDNKTDSYENIANSFKIKFPKSIDDNKQIKYKYGDYSIDWSILDIGKSDISYVSNDLKSNNIKELTDINQSVTYSNVQNNVDIEYILSGNKIKENIYLNEYINDFSLTFEYKIKGLTLDYSDKSNIVFLDENNKPMFSLSDLYMIDSEGDISFELDFSVIETGNKTYQITILANNEWLKNATYPVTIDPTINSITTSMRIYDTWISSGRADYNYSSSDTMILTNEYSTARGLLYFYIPSDILDKTIIYSHLSFSKRNVTLGDQLNIYQNTEIFASSSATWNNAPNYDNLVVDYYIVDSNTPFMFDITESVKEWQADGILRTPGFTIGYDEVTGSYNSVYQNGISSDLLKPIISIGYEEPSGLKDYWTYTSQDIGLAGTGYISDYTGNLTWVRNEYSLDNEFMSLTLSFYYNNYDRNEDIGYGMGWRTNYNMEIKHEEFSDSYYLIKPDGNKVYFSLYYYDEIYSGTTMYQYISEDGSRMKLTRIEDSGSTRDYVIETASELSYSFNNNGRLTTIKNLQTHHEINVYYIDSTSQKIDYVEAEADNRIEFTYSGDSLYKTELQLKQSDSSLRGVERRYYYYDTYGNISYINIDYRYGTAPNTLWSTSYETIVFHFDSDNKLIYGYHYQDDYKIQYSYNSNNKVDNFLIKNNNSLINSTDILYEPGRTIYTNYDNKSIYYSFDNYGHTVNVLDDYGNCAYYKYSGLFYIREENQIDEVDYGYEGINLPPNYYNNHNLIINSEVTNQLQNPIDNHSFEEIGGWTYNVTGYDNSIIRTQSDSLIGNYSLRIDKYDSNDVYASQEVDLEAGGYYLTGWIKNGGDGPGAYIDVEGVSSISTINKVYGSSEWKRFAIYFILDNSATVTIKLTNESLSRAFFDNIQLSKDAVDSRYNALLNNSFEEDSDYWTMNQSNITSLNETGFMQDILGDKALIISGDGSQKKYASQVLDYTFQEDESLIIGAWAKADAVPNKVYYDYNNEEILNDNRFFGIKLIIETIDDYYNYVSYEYYLSFDSSIGDWQYQMINIDVENTIFRITTQVIYQGEGIAYFDNIQLFHDNITTKYKYIADSGNLESITNSDGEIVLTYDEEDKLESITKNNVTTTVERDAYNLIEEITKNNVRTTFEYDASNRQVSATYMGYDRDIDLQNQDSWFKNTTSYTADGQYINSMTDEFGNIGNIFTNQENGLVSNVIDAIGNSQSFIYNKYGGLESTTVAENGTTNTIVGSYEYDNQGKLEIVRRDGYYYEFVYNDLEQLTSVRIHDGQSYENLMEYDYWEEEISSELYYTNLLKKQTYGNGDYVSFTYTDQNQIKTIKFNDTLRFVYDYDLSGRLAILKDIHNNNIYFYSYNLFGSLEKITDEDGNTIQYSYDEDGNFSGVTYKVGTISRGVTYHYNSTTGEYDFTEYDVGSTSITKNYDFENDSLRRLNKIDLTIGAITFSKEYSYDDNKVETGMGNATNRIYRIEYYKNGIRTYLYQYSYDENNNITTILVANESNQVDRYDYEYDGFNQLVREDVKVHNASGTFERTYIYDYDDYANITHIYEYEYTTNTPITLLKQTNFEYNNTWADQLTRKRVIVNYSVIEDLSYYYDESGNPTSIHNNLSNLTSDTFTWDGRSLTSVNKAYVFSSTFKYNSEGLRTQKTYSSYSSSYTVDYVLDGDKIIVEDRDGDIIYYTYDVDGSLLSMNYNGNEYFYITDLQGNVIKIVDITGNTVVEYKYDAWGNIVYKYDSGLNIDDINPFRYRGYYFDVETGYYYLQSRYYNPEIGRFISSDGLVGKVGDTQSHNMYAYCANNPVMYSDISGEFPVLISIAAIVYVIWIAHDIYQIASGNVEFIPDEENNGGLIENSYKVQNPTVIYGYSIYLRYFDENRDCFDGSAAGIAAEWIVHNAAYDISYIPSNLGFSSRQNEQAMHANIGRTLYDDGRWYVELPTAGVEFIINPYAYVYDAYQEIKKRIGE
jgi:RHS repeat-associated protein